MKKVFRASEQDHEEVAIKRRWWARRQRQLDPIVLFSSTKLGPKSICLAFVAGHLKASDSSSCSPHGHRKTTTLVGVIRASGWVAPSVVDNLINGQFFLSWVQQQLTRELKQSDVVIMDNLSSHKIVGLRESIESTGANLFYLPPYSPDFNPIELAFPKLKQLIRSAKK